GQLVTRFDPSLAHLRPCRLQLDPGAFRERLHPDRDEQVMCLAKLGARMDPTTLASQPLAEEPGGPRGPAPAPARTPETRRHRGPPAPPRPAGPPPTRLGARARPPGFPGAARAPGGPT